MSSYEEILNRMKDDITSESSKMEGTFTMDNLSIVANEIARILEMQINTILPITGGNKNHYIYWAKEIEGIGAVKVLPLANGNGTVKLILLSDEFTSVSADKIEEVKKHIDDNRPIGANVEIISAKPKEVAINIKLEKINNVSDAELKEAIKSKIDSYIKKIKFDEKYRISYYKIGDIIFDIDGVLDIISYTINGKESSIKGAEDEYFYLSEVIVNGS